MRMSYFIANQQMYYKQKYNVYEIGTSVTLHNLCKFIVNNDDNYCLHFQLFE